MTETWKPIAGYETLYEVSDEGRVRSIRSPHGDGILRGDVDRYGYRRVVLVKDGGRKRHKVHRLVCHAFNGPPPEGTECGHRNGQRQDNNSANLAWITRSENTLDSIRHGTFHRHGPPGGERHSQARLSDQQIAAIRADRVAGLSERALAAKYGISRAHAHQIVTGKKRVRRMSDGQ